jgi:hypothetical protein
MDPLTTATAFAILHQWRPDIGAKHEFERKAQSFCREIRSYHGDNGQFVENEFKEDKKQKQQSLTVCGVGAHHQSGNAKCQIRILSERVCSMLLHSFVCWPEAISTRLWPFALLQANFLLNHLPQKDGTTQAGRFSRSKHQLDPKDWHTFGF